MEKINNKFQSFGKIKQNDHIFALKVRTESNGIGVLKTLIVLLLIVVQVAALVLSYIYFMSIFRWYFILAMCLTGAACIHVLSSDYHGQAKATWVY